MVWPLPTTGFMYIDVYFTHCVVQSSIPPQRWTGLHPCILTWDLPSNTTTWQGLCDSFWTPAVLLSLSEILISRHVLPAGAFPSCHKSCQLLWHSITPSVPAITKVPCWGIGGHSIPPLIGWFGLVKRASFAVWNETLSTSDRDHEHGATGLALSDTFQFCSYRKKLCVHVSKHLCVLCWVFTVPQGSQKTRIGHWFTLF